MKRILIILLSAFTLSLISAELCGKAKIQTVTYVVNMHCQNCVNKLTDNLSFLKGVKDFKISLKDKTIVIKYDPAKIQEARFEEIIRKLGYSYRKEEECGKPADRT